MLKQSTSIVNKNTDIAPNCFFKLQTSGQSSGQTSSQVPFRALSKSHAILLGLLTGDKSLMDSDARTAISHGD